MRNKKVLLIVQAALIAAIYVVLTYFISCIQSCLRRNSGPDFRSTYHFTGIYAGSHSGTFYRMPVKQSAHRLHAA